jgi:hypothetical protein
VLQQVLREIETAQGLINLTDLARKLGIERSALESMLEFWVRKGRLKNDEREAEASCTMYNDAACGGNCPGPQGCPFIMKMPRTYSLTLPGED